MATLQVDLEWILFLVTSVDDDNDVNFLHLQKSLLVACLQLLTISYMDINIGDRTAEIIVMKCIHQ